MRMKMKSVKDARGKEKEMKVLEGVTEELDRERGE